MSADDIHPVVRLANWLEPSRRYERAAQQASRLALASDELSDELVSAFTAGPYSLVRTPGGVNAKETVAALVSDSFADSKTGDISLGSLLNVVRAALKSTDPAVRLPAQAWLSTFAKQHGDWHAQDFIDGSDE